jgi:glycine cleavage system H protein
MLSRRADGEEDRVLIPEHLRYTSEHEWVAPGAPEVTVGITQFAQNALGDIVFVQLPDPGTSVEAGQPLGEVESTKSVSEIYAPISGAVTAHNDQLRDEPELINSDPYGAGWLVRIAPADPGAVDQLLDAAAYRGLIEE